MAGTKIIEDGIWTWFNTPYAAYADGKLFVGSWPTNNVIAQVSCIDLANGSDTVSTSLGPVVETDDHDNPAVVVLASGKVFAAWSFHNGNSYNATTTSAGDIRTFGSVVTASSGNSDAYAQCVEFGTSVKKLIWFTRRNAGAQYYRTSTDEGATWSSGDIQFATGTDRPYFRYWKTSDTRIDFVCTNGHPSTSVMSLYHGYITIDSSGDLTFYKSDGTLIGDETDLPLSVTSDLTQVYDGTTSEAWIWDIKFINGQPTIVAAIFPSHATTAHEYHRFRFNGTTWDAEKICDGGTTGTADYLYASEPNYSGGVCLDPQDEDTVYASLEYGSGNFRVEKWEKSGSWSKTADLSGNTSNVNARPFAINCGGTTRVLWWGGTYTSYTVYDADIYIDGGVTFRTAKVTTPVLREEFTPPGCAIFLPMQEGTGTPADLMGNYTPSMTGTLNWNSDSMGWYLSGFSGVSSGTYLSFDSLAAAYESGGFPRGIALMFSNSSTSQQCLFSLTGTTDTPFSMIRVNVSGSNQIAMESRNDANTLGQAIGSTSLVNDGNIHVVVGAELAANRRMVSLDDRRLALNTDNVPGARTINKATVGLRRGASNLTAFSGRVYAVAVFWGRMPQANDLCRDWKIGNFSGTAVPSSGGGGGARRRRLLICGAAA